MSAPTREELRLEAQELMLNYTPGSMVYDVASAFLAYMEREDKVLAAIKRVVPWNHELDAVIKAIEEGRG